MAISLNALLGKRTQQQDFVAEEEEKQRQHQIKMAEMAPKIFAEQLRVQHAADVAAQGDADAALQGAIAESMYPGQVDALAKAHRDVATAKSSGALSQMWEGLRTKGKIPLAPLFGQREAEAGIARDEANIATAKNVKAGEEGASDLAAEAGRMRVGRGIEEDVAAGNEAINKGEVAKERGGYIQQLTRAKDFADMSLANRAEQAADIEMQTAEATRPLAGNVAQIEQANKLRMLDPELLSSEIARAKIENELATEQARAGVKFIQEVLMKDPAMMQRKFGGRAPTKYEAASDMVDQVVPESIAPEDLWMRALKNIQVPTQ